MRRAHTEQVRAVDVDQGKGGAHVGLLRGNLDVAEFEIFDVADEEALGRKLAEHRWLRIFLLALRGLQARRLRGAAANLMQIDIADFHVFDEVSGHAAEDGRQLSRSVAGDIADEDALESTDSGVFWTAHALAET